MADQAAHDAPGAHPRKPRRRLGRAIAMTLAAILVVLIVVVALIPWIAGNMVPAIAERNINDQIQGSATVSRASLSWTGNQRIGPINIVDLDGRPVANIEIVSSRGLFSILGIVMGTSPMDLGTTTVTGSATIIRRADGTIHLQDVFKPTPSAEPQDVYLPETLSGRFVLDGLDVIFIDDAQLADGSAVAVVRIPALSGEARVENATRAEARLGGHFLYGPTVEQATLQGGSLQLNASADDLTEPSGRLVADRALYSASLDASGISVAIPDMLAQMQGRLIEAIGDQLRAQASIDGTLTRGHMTFAALAPGLEADLRFETVDAVLQTSRPGRISVREGSVLSLLPGFSEAIAAQDDVTFDQLPGATITIDDVRIPLPIGERPLDLRGGSFTIAARTGETIGRVRTPAAPLAGGQPGEVQEYRLAPIQAQVSSSDLGDRITIRAQTQATLGGESAGALEVDLAAIDPLDAQGRPRPMLARDLDGAANLTGFATIILQPFVDGLGLQLWQDVGPELDIQLRASASASAADPSVETALPPTRLALDVRSENITAGADFLLDQNILQSTDRHAEIQIGTLAPAMTRLLMDQGLIVDSGAGLMVSARDLQIDFARLFADDPAEDPADRSADLRALSATLNISTTPAAGRILLPDLAGASRQARQWEIAAGEVLLDAASLEQGLQLRARTSARLEGAPAGMLDADVRVMELLDADGRLRPGLPAIDGRASLQQIATAILQPLVEGLGLNLRDGAGPTLDLLITASSQAAEAPGPEGATTIPRSIVDLTIRSDNINGAIPLALDARTLAIRGDGAQITIRSPGILFGDAAQDAGVRLTDGGFLAVTGRRASLALDDPERPLLDRLAGELELTMGAFGLFPVQPPDAPASAPTTIPAPPAPLMFQQMAVTAGFARERAPTLRIQGTGHHLGAEFNAQGSFQLAGLDGALDVAAVRPLGQFELRNLPSSLITLFLTPDPLATLDPVQLSQDLLGQSFNLNLAAAELPGGAPTDRRLSLSLRSPRATAELAADLDNRALHLQQMNAGATITPALATSLLRAFAGDQLAGPPRIAEPARLTLAMQPTAIPLTDGLPNLAAAGETSLRLGLEGRLLIDQITLAETPERPARPIGFLGLQEVSLQADFPLAALAAEAPPAPVRLVFNASVLGSPDQRMMVVRTLGRGTMTAARPVGAFAAEMHVDVADGARLDQILGQDGMFVQAVGQTLALQSTATVDFPAAAPEDPAEPSADRFAFDRARLEATITAPRLTTQQPLRLTILPDRMLLDAPAALQWQMHHNWANRFLLGIMPGTPPEPQQARFTQPTPIRIGLIGLALARGENGGPLQPGIFNTNIHITSPAAQMEIGGIATPLSGLNAQLMSSGNNNVIGFSLRLQDAGGGPGPSGEPAVQLAGGIYNLADERGILTPDAALITAEGNARNIPTAIIDGLAQQNQLLVDALGPQVNVHVRARGVSPTGGAIALTATSERARAELSGIMRGGRFIADQPSQVSLAIITPELGQRMSRGLPLVGHLEKTTEEAPATLSITDLVLPLDGDLRGLSGRITFDPGEARFGVSRPFAPVLRFIDEPLQAVVGRRLQPMTMTITEGILRYDRFDLPIGQFTFMMEGNVDLVDRRMDVITFVPFGAVSDDVAGELNTGLGRLLGIASPSLESMTMVPFRARGGFDNFTVQPDLQMLGQELQRQLLRPDRIIGGTARDILDRLNPGNNNGEPPPPPRPPRQQPPPEPTPEPEPQPGPQPPPNPRR